MNNIDIHPSSIAIRTTLYGIAISVILIFVKGISGYLGHSYALIADATESGADILSSGLLWLGLRIAMKEPDKEHPYGHGKAEPLTNTKYTCANVGITGQKKNDKWKGLLVNNAG